MTKDNMTMKVIKLMPPKRLPRQCPDCSVLMKLVRGYATGTDIAITETYWHCSVCGQLQPAD